MLAGAYSGDGSGCETLIYSPQDGNGYANLTTQYYMGITDVETFAQCCGLCSYEKDCVGWSRIAGADNFNPCTAVWWRKAYIIANLVNVPE